MRDTNAMNVDMVELDSFVWLGTPTLSFNLWTLEVIFNRKNLPNDSLVYLQGIPSVGSGSWGSGEEHISVEVACSASGSQAVSRPLWLSR